MFANERKGIWPSEDNHYINTYSQSDVQLVSCTKGKQHIMSRQAKPGTGAGASSSEFKTIDPVDVSVFSMSTFCEMRYKRAWKGGEESRA